MLQNDCGYAIPLLLQSSQPTVNLVGDVRIRPLRPLAARLRDDMRHLQLGDLLRVCQELREKAAGRMPCDVAVEGPHSFRHVSSLKFCFHVAQQRSGDGGKLPGLSAALNCIAMYPCRRTIMTSRRRGFCWLTIAPSHSPSPSFRINML